MSYELHRAWNVFTFFTLTHNDKYNLTKRNHAISCDEVLSLKCWPANRGFFAHLISKIHHDKAQGIDKAKLMFNNPLKWHSLHQEIDGSTSEK